MSDFSTPWKGLLTKGSSKAPAEGEPNNGENSNISMILEHFLLYQISSPYLGSLSAKESPNLSPKLNDLKTVFIAWRASRAKDLSLVTAASRWIFRYRAFGPQAQPLKENQISPMLNISSELLGLVDRYTDTLDRNIHLCFVLHAEGLLTEEISGITHLAPNLVELYIRSAKGLIKEHLKTLMEAS
ncbi:hypothetical protein GW915_13470 [bacterium]|nr:hypothetical protein [bacterium]